MSNQEKANPELIEVIRELQSSLDASESKRKKTLWGVVHGLTSLIEATSGSLAYHHQEVSRVARYTAKMMGLPKERIEGLYMAALVHDIGKIKFPTKLLEKITKLTEREFDIVKEHPRVGYDILKRIDFDMPVATIVLQHHEYMDGSGYPKGLSGNNILLEARILLVANSLEAMTSPRPYRSAYTLDEALNELTKQGDILYDSSVVKACKKLFTE